MSYLQVCCKIEPTRSGNFIFSPFNVTTALAMTWVGARKETARQIKEVLELDVVDDVHSIHQAIYDILQDIQGDNSHTSNNSTVLHAANRFYVDETYNILDEFSNILSKKYMSEPGRLNFAKDLEKARRDINEWVEIATNSKVKNLVKENVLSSSTRFVLVNAIYFRGTWSIRFDPDKIHRGSFYKKKFEKPIMITMMENRAVFPFVIDYEFKCKVVELPYTGKHLRMLIFLPFEVEGLPLFERKFNPGLVKFLKKSMAKTKVTVVIPQLKMNSSLPLGDALMALGLRDLFYHDKADLSGIAGTTDLHYFDFIHNTFLDASDGAITVQPGLSKTVMSRNRNQELSFIADHPFIFLIYDKPSKMIFFIGRFSDPSAIAIA